MGSSFYSPAADLLYLTVLFLGFAAGAALKAVIYRNGRFGASGYVSMSAVSASLAVAALALAIVGFGGLPLLADTGFRPVWLCVLCISALLFVFPRAVGFPVLVLTGFAVVLYGYFFVRVPEMEGDSAVLLEIAGNPDGTFRCAILEDAPYGGLVSAADGYNAIRYMSLSLDRRLPIVGGTFRGAVAGVVSQNMDRPPILLPWAVQYPFLSGRSNPLPGITVRISDTALPPVHGAVVHRYTLARDGSLRLLP